MKIFKIIVIFILTLIYLFINYFTVLFEFMIDKELDNGDSVSALAKEVSQNASCTLDIIGSLIETSKEDTIHEFECHNEIKKIHFSIYIFTTEDAKDSFLKENNKRKIYFQKNFHSYYNPKHDINLTRGMPEFYNPCFKQGQYFVVCENAQWHKNGVPQFTGAPYYHEFKGEEIEWKIPNLADVENLPRDVP